MSEEEVARLKATITLDTTKLDAGLAAARRGIDGLAEGADKSKGTISGLSGVMSVFGGTVLSKLADGLMKAGANSVKMAGDFESSMNVLQYVTKSTSGQFDALQDKARALGADIKLPGTSSLDAAKAMLELSKAGLSVSDTMSAARSSLQLAAAAQISAGDAAKITANSLNQFQLSGDQAIRVADLLAAAANSSSGEITDMAQALSQSGSAFAAVKIPIEDATTAIAMLAQKGILGSDAGTSLKTMLTQLSSPTEKAKQVMDYLGLSLFDANGKFVGLREAANRYQAATKNLSDEQKLQVATTLAGTDGMRGLLNVLAQGGTAFDTAKSKVTELGAAQGAADSITKGFNGSVDALKSSWESWSTSAAQSWLPVMTDVINKINEASTATDNWLKKFADWNASKIFDQPLANGMIAAAGTTALQTYEKQQEADGIRLESLKKKRQKAIADSQTGLGVLKGIFTTGGAGEDFNQQISRLESQMAKRAAVIKKWNLRAEQDIDNQIKLKMKQRRDEAAAEAAKNGGGGGSPNAGLAAILDGSANKKAPRAKKAKAAVKPQWQIEWESAVSDLRGMNQSIIDDLGDPLSSLQNKYKNIDFSKGGFKVFADNYVKAWETIRRNEKNKEIKGQSDSLAKQLLKLKDATVEGATAADLYGKAWKELTPAQKEVATPIVEQTKEVNRLTEAQKRNKDAVLDQMRAYLATGGIGGIGNWYKTNSEAQEKETKRINGITEKIAALNAEYKSLVMNGSAFDRFLEKNQIDKATAKPEELDRQRGLFDAQNNVDQAGKLEGIKTKLRGMRDELGLIKDASTESKIAWEVFGKRMGDLAPEIQAHIKAAVPEWDGILRYQKLKKNLDDIKSNIKDTFKDAFADAMERGGNFFSTLVAGFQATIKRILAEKLAGAAVDGIFGLLGKKGVGLAGETEKAKNDLLLGSAQINIAAANLKASADSVLSSSTVMASATGVPGAGGSGIAVQAAVLAAMEVAKSQNTGGDRTTAEAAKENATASKAVGKTLVESAKKSSDMQIMASTAMVQIMMSMAQGRGAGGGIGSMAAGIGGSMLGSLATKQIGGALGSFGGPVGTVLGSIAGGLLGKMFGGKKKFFGLFSNGGRPPVGYPSIVGDGGNGSGAELFVPDRPGRIYSNRDTRSILAGMGSGGNTQPINIINPVFNSAADFARVEALTRAKLRRNSRLM